MTKGETYQNINDLSKIEVILSHNERKRINPTTKKEETIFIDLPNIKCKYVESKTKLGKIIEFKREFLFSLIKQGMFVKI